MNGILPRDLAPSVYIISKKNNRMLQEPLVGNSWVKDLNLLHPSFSHSTLWNLCNFGWPHIHDEIHWKHKSGQHSASPAYGAQFVWAIETNLNEIIWSAWASPKCKFFGCWLVVQDRIWSQCCNQQIGKTQPRSAMARRQGVSRKGLKSLIIV